MRVGVLDLCRVGTGETARGAIFASLEFAQWADRNGFYRFWVGHHFGHDVGHWSPELMVSIVAGITNQIRVGAAGILLRYESALRVASDFRLLEGIYPARIDLGLARGAVPPAFAAEICRGEYDYAENIAELLGFLRGGRQVAANPTNVAPPEVWMLGTGASSAELAAKHGTAYCHGLFAAAGSKSAPNSEAAARYRDSFAVRGDLSGPRLATAIAGICAPSCALAEEILARAGETGVAASIVGDSDTCTRVLAHVVEEQHPSELIFLDLCQDPYNKRRSCEMFAKAAESI